MTPTVAQVYWDRQFTHEIDHHRLQNEQISRDLMRAMTPRMNVCFNSSYVTVLEVGCGTGELAWTLRAKFDCTVHAYDISSAAIAAAKTQYCTRYNQDKLFFYTGSWQTGSYDVAVCSNVLEHFMNPWPVVDSLLKVAPLAMIVVPYKQAVLDRYECEGGAGHVRSFDALMFTERYDVVDAVTFKTEGWQHVSVPGENPLQLAVLLERK